MEGPDLASSWLRAPEGMEGYSIMEKGASVQCNRLRRPVTAQTGRTRLSEILVHLKQNNKRQTRVG